MKPDYKQLKKKGWTNEEISKTRVKFKKLDKKRKAKHKVLDIIVYLFLLAFSICANILIIFLIFPFILLIPNFLVYLAVGFIALAFGILFGFIVSEVEHIGKAKHNLYTALITVVIFLNFHIINTAIETNHRVFVLGIIYIILFLAPYIYMLYKRKDYGKH
ncbi:MAG: hypothetical protein KKF44_07410 [Nanoarchaeota archaeon]|nr:hypothetical protein [Nanoarchaeota archaeon]